MAPGVSFYSSVLIAGEIGEIDQFDRAAELISCAGLDPVVIESGDSRTEGGFEGKQQAIALDSRPMCERRRESGDRSVCRSLCLIEAQEKHQVAIIATDRKPMVSILHILARKEVYDPPGLTAQLSDGKDVDQLRPQPQLPLSTCRPPVDLILEGFKHCLVVFYQ